MKSVLLGFSILATILTGSFAATNSQIFTVNITEKISSANNTACLQFDATGFIYYIDTNYGVQTFQPKKINVLTQFCQVDKKNVPSGDQKVSFLVPADQFSSAGNKSANFNFTINFTSSKKNYELKSIDFAYNFFNFSSDGQVSKNINVTNKLWAHETSKKEAFTCQKNIDYKLSENWILSLSYIKYQPYMDGKYGKERECKHANGASNVNVSLLMAALSFVIVKITSL